MNSTLASKKEKNTAAALVVSDLVEFASENELNVAQLAKQLSLPRSTVAKWFGKGRSRTTPSKSNLERISTFLARENQKKTINKSNSEAKERAEKVKHLLLLLESELSWFKDGSPSARTVFRNRLDPYDVGYVASMLMMMGDEDKFRRWLALSTNRFRRFKGGKQPWPGR
jgi:transposase-like protein